MIRFSSYIFSPSGSYSENSALFFNIRLFINYSLPVGLVLVDFLKYRGLQVLKDAHFREVSDLRANASKMKSEFEKSNHDLRLSSERVHKKLEETLWERNLADSEWKQRLDSLEKEKNKELSEEIGKRMDLERKLVVSYEKQSELRSRLEEEMTKTREIETSHKVSGKKLLVPLNIINQLFLL